MKTLAPLLLLCLCAGCLSSPARKAYLVEIDPAPAAKAAPADAPSLRIGVFAAAEPYGAARMLVWEEKTGRLHGTKGAELSTPPAVALRNSARRALEASGRYAAVVDSDLPAARALPVIAGFVERSRLEKRADGRLAYVLDATFRLRPAGGAPVRSFALRAEKPAAGDRPAQQAAAARAAYADLAAQLVAAVAD